MVLLQAGFVSNAPNPKTAAFYLAILPQFVNPHHALLAQAFVLGAVHIAVSTSFTSRRQQSFMSFCTGIVLPSGFSVGCSPA
jgi:hypothetical protein